MFCVHGNKRTTWRVTLYLQRSPAAGQGGHGRVGQVGADVNERVGGGEVEAVLVGDEAVDDGVGGPDVELGVLGVGEGAGLVLEPN